jgi:glycosyltransferase involved in cell wall biosynthesis
VYDCLFPYTVGGAERWYRSLAERLAAEGHDVTYVTQRQWGRDESPKLPGIRVVAGTRRRALYGRSGRRRIAPPVLFGAAVLGHLARHGRRYDVVHTGSFPYFPLLAAAALGRRGGYRLYVDWFEVWSREYWREYLGPLGGRIGSSVQALCMRVRQEAFCFARMTAARLRREGVGGPVTLLEGAYAGPLARPQVADPEPVVVFAGRHIAEKRPAAVVAAIARARADRPALRARILGDGPEHPAVLAAIARHGLAGVVEAPGFVSTQEVEDALGRALCLVLPSRREGYGLVVVEAAARGTPSVVVASPDNAAVELVQDGVNGFVAASARPDDLARAIVAVAEAGRSLRESTADWFAANAHRLSLDASLQRVLDAYRSAGDAAAASARS